MDGMCLRGPKKLPFHQLFNLPLPRFVQSRRHRPRLQVLDARCHLLMLYHIGNLRVSHFHELPRLITVRNGVPLAHVLLLSATARTPPVSFSNHATGTLDKGGCLILKIRTLMPSRRSRSLNDMMTMSQTPHCRRQCHLRHHLIFHHLHHPLAHVKSRPQLSNLTCGHQAQKVKMLLYTNRLSLQVKMPCNARQGLKRSKQLMKLPPIVQVVGRQRLRTNLKGKGRGATAVKKRRMTRKRKRKTRMSTRMDNPLTPTMIGPYPTMQPRLTNVRVFPHRVCRHHSPVAICRLNNHSRAHRGTCLLSLYSADKVCHLHCLFRMP